MPATIASTLQFIAKGSTVGEATIDFGKGVLPHWPADAFGICAYLLDVSGTYDHVLRNGWPTKSTSVKNWQETARRIGDNWLALQAESYLPEEVKEWWKIVWAQKDIKLSELSKREGRALDVIDSLVKICIVADEAHACLNYSGMASDALTRKNLKDAYEEWPAGEKPEDLVLEFLDRCTDNLECKNLDEESGSTLATVFDPAILRVLPKKKTAQVGVSMRSLTHNIGLWTKNEVVPYWETMIYAAVSPQDKKGLNLLLIPWPPDILPSQFSICAPDQTSIDMPDTYSFFDYKASSGNPLREAAAMVEYVGKLLAKAKDTAGRVDVVVFPEVSLTVDSFDQIAKAYGDVIIVAGVDCEEASQGDGCALESSNRVQIAFPLPTIKPILQSKHHRWQLSRDQIIQYGLGTILDADKTWWENMRIERRSLNFVQLSDRFAMAAIVCEDLARQDPVAGLIRTVGPNLLIALLMDGPQIGGRWPNRYATVLADDPSSSVLTLTSIGMVKLSRPPSVKCTSKSIGLWKDPFSAPVEIELAEDAEAVLLCLSMRKSSFHSADGRKSRFRSVTPVFCGLHQICLD